MVLPLFAVGNRRTTGARARLLNAAIATTVARNGVSTPCGRHLRANGVKRDRCLLLRVNLPTGKLCPPAVK